MDPNAVEYGSLTTYLLALNTAIYQKQGLRLECLLSLTDRQKNPFLHRLIDAKILRYTTDLREEQEIAVSTLFTWTETVQGFWRTAKCLADATHAVEAFEQASGLMQAIIRAFNEWEAWQLPVLFGACRDIRVLAMRADAYCRTQGNQEEHLEEAARLINKAFTICINDRAPMAQSRKWGTYAVLGILFKTYFKLNNLSLTKNVLRAVEVSELPSLQYFPKAHLVTWQYYLGVSLFMNGDYPSAQVELQRALQACTARAPKNVELIFSYLIPATLMTSRHLPSVQLLRKFPTLSTLFLPVIAAIRAGNPAAFDVALRKQETQLIGRRLYLTLERCRPLCLRTLARKVYLQRDRQTRIQVAMFTTALNLGYQLERTQNARQRAKLVAKLDGDKKSKAESPKALMDRLTDVFAKEINAEPLPFDDEEAECILANLIAGGFMKGYISRERSMVVLSAKDPFPKICR
ncbi:hypothetical protein BCR37DRAFT_382959 [Protomyces lactucae-debilis]|uniref:PCI domain-containing protein n=1 Tax=Protomyces lactucae-debilis TaxID=2754530 RepID=A0A1Y2EZT3_PROLT|nr:uncharacterized protein BCR37DRAFT_382959 [Protomyces lactucae-debilis]ORY76967.1 hypothetical protein BCR37DRAFT_382959 [Protomyces lactucae-debilis]